MLDWGQALRIIKRSATSFESEASAIKCVKENLSANADEIVNWLNDK